MRKGDFIHYTEAFRCCQPSLLAARRPDFERRRLTKSHDSRPYAPREEEISRYLAIAIDVWACGIFDSRHAWRRLGGWIGGVRFGDGG